MGLIDEHFKDQQDYLLSRGITPKMATKLKVEVCGAGMLAERGIEWKGLTTGITWHVWDRHGNDTGNVGARVWYEDRIKNPGPKFVSPKNQVPKLYHTPLANWAADLQHGDTVVLCESYLKADIAGLCGYRAVGVSGVWGWSHKKRIIADFEQLPWKELGLKLLISFDSNVAPDKKNQLSLALERLTAEMERLGAAVYVAYLPKPATGEDWGLDDYYMAHGREGVEKYLASGVQVESNLSQHMHILNREAAVVRSLSKVVDIERGVFMTRNDFINLAYSERAVWYTDENNKLKKVQVAREWLEWPGRTVVEDAVYAPGQDQVIYATDDTPLSYNLWKGMPLEPEWDDACVALWEHWLFTAFPNEEERHWFTCWWAYQLQNLGTKLATSLVLVGESGVGKGWLAAIAKQIFGQDNYAPGDLGTIGSRFNADYATKQLLIIEEAKMPRGADADVVYNKLKDLVTNGQLRIERKGVDAFSVDNYCNVMLQGNNIDILKLDEFDRRFAVFHVNGKDIANVDTYWQPRWAALQHGMAAAVYAWLLHYNCAGYNPHGMAIATQAKQDMLETSHSPREQWIIELKNEPDTVLEVMGNVVDGTLATAKELEYVYLNGQIPLWEIDKKQSDAMSRCLKLARVPMANDGGKIRDSDGVTAKYFLVRPHTDGKPGPWKAQVDKRKFWKKVKSGGKM